MSSSRQPELYAAALVTYIVAAVALALRLFARRKMKAVFVWEDYLAVVAFVIGSGFTFLSIAKLRWGLGRHLADIANMSAEQITYQYFVELWADMWLYTFSVGLSKFVILGLYWRTFGSSAIRQPIRVIFGFSVAWIMARVALILLQCQPIQKFWHKDLPGTCPLTPMMSLFATGIPHFILEVAILLCPLIEIWKLHLPKAKKLAVAAMFTSGLLVCLSALGTIVHTVDLDRKKHDLDLTWDGLDDQIWAVCDVNLASFATSLPLLRPIFRSFGGIFSGLKSNSPRPNTSGNTASTDTFGSAPIKRFARSFSDADSALEYAVKGGYLTDDTYVKEFALHDITPKVSDA